jgi:hypothetical protein
MDPGGVQAISRWLSAAMPPVTMTQLETTPEGSQRFGATTPTGVDLVGLVFDTGGVAALNHRLTAATPAGVEPVFKRQVRRYL